MKRCLLVGAGELAEQTEHTLMECIQQGNIPYIVAVDGGYEYLCRLGVTPDHVLGDFDSMTEEARVQLRQFTEDQVQCLPVEKDDTDMLAAIKHVIQAGYTEAIIFGGTGGRFDHTIANIQSMLYYKRNGGNAVMIDAQNEIRILTQETITFSGMTGKRMSLFAMTPRVSGVTLTGFHYSLSEATITNDFPIGVSNEFTADQAYITVGEGIALAITER